VDLAADGSYQLRQTWLNRPDSNTFDDIGRWRLEPSGQRLVLRGGRKAPLYLQPLEGGAVLLKHDLEGQPIRSDYNDLLTLLTVPEPISPRLFLAGMFRLLPQGPNIRLCVTGQRLPVALEGDYKRLLQAYRNVVPAGGQGHPLLVSLRSQSANTPCGGGIREGAAWPRLPAASNGIYPRGSQPNGIGRKTRSSPSGPTEPAAHRLETAVTAGTRGPDLINSPGRPQELLQLATDSEGLSGTNGCNRLLGGFQLTGDQLRFSQLVSTKIVCTADVIAFEQQYLKALDQVRQWNIDKRSLLLQDGAGRSLLLYRL
jgi:copper homeostasis protein (lipoprotein)